MTIDKDKHDWLVLMYGEEDKLIYTYELHDKTELEADNHALGFCVESLDCEYYEIAKIPEKKSESKT